MITRYGGSYLRRKCATKDKYNKDVDKSEWRSPTRYDIMNNFKHLP